MAPDARYAFDEERTDEAIRHNNVLYDALDRRFKALHPELKRLGIRVWNCTEGSGLTAFPHMPYEQAVERAAAEAGAGVPSAGWYEPSGRSPRSI
jgi:hypothetical protein